MYIRVDVEDANLETPDRRTRDIGKHIPVKERYGFGSSSKLTCIIRSLYIGISRKTLTSEKASKVLQINLSAPPSGQNKEYFGILAGFLGFHHSQHSRSLVKPGVMTRKVIFEVRESSSSVVHYAFFISVTSHARYCCLADRGWSIENSNNGSSCGRIATEDNDMHIAMSGTSESLCHRLMLGVPLTKTVNGRYEDDEKVALRARIAAMEGAISDGSFE